MVALDRSVRKFDDQAGAMVQHFNALTEATEARLDEVSDQVTEQLDGRLASLSMRMDEVSAQSARQQAEVANVVGARVDQAEDRINERILTAEARVNETVGQRVADIDAYVGRVSAGLDDAVAMLSDRIAGAETRFDEVNQAIDAMAGRLDSVDVDAIDEMKDRVASAAGEVELVRIEVERFQKSMGESMDKTVGRIVEIETQLQEQHMDVETAVQLERLEEVERALLALDPSQFVRRDEATSAFVGSRSEPVSPPDPTHAVRAASHRTVLRSRASPWHSESPDPKTWRRPAVAPRPRSPNHPRWPRASRPTSALPSAKHCSPAATCRRSRSTRCRRAPTATCSISAHCC